MAMDYRVNYGNGQVSDTVKSRTVAKQRALEAAAPDLLAALQNLVAEVSQTLNRPFPRGQEHPLVQAARTALAKAEG